MNHSLLTILSGSILVLLPLGTIAWLMLDRRGAVRGLRKFWDLDLTMFHTAVAERVIAQRLFSIKTAYLLIALLVVALPIGADLWALYALTKLWGAEWDVLAPGLLSIEILVLGTQYCVKMIRPVVTPWFAKWLDRSSVAPMPLRYTTTDDAQYWRIVEQNIPSAPFWMRAYWISTPYLDIGLKLAGILIGAYALWTSVHALATLGLEGGAWFTLKHSTLWMVASLVPIFPCRIVAHLLLSVAFDHWYARNGQS